jgi:4-amino-4-deoxy-L-arabinose transferase-like glycosyltransferase
MTALAANDAPRPPMMIYVSPVIELVRARPALVFWTAALAQALLWTLVPALFYASPPGGVPLVLAIGREWQLGSWAGPPLAFWAAEAAFRAAGNSVVGVYVLSQVCVVVTYWAVFALGRSIAGAKHAALAALATAGLGTFSVATPEFGQAVLAMPLTALALLLYWRAVGEGRPRSWIGLGIWLGLLMLTTYAGLIVVAAIVGVTVVTRRGRAALLTPYPWAGLIVALIVLSPHLWWLSNAGLPALVSPDGPPGASVLLLRWPGYVAGAILVHAGLIVLAVLAGAMLKPRGDVPVIERAPPGRFGKAFVYAFAIAPVLIATLAMAIGNDAAVGTGVAPFVVLSGLAVVVAAGNAIHIHRQSILGWMWLGLLVGPALLVVAANAVLPWAGVALQTGEPAAALGQFFTDTFNRRTGRPLTIVVGEARLGALVALASSDRPALFIDADPDRAPWIAPRDVGEKGAVVVWPVADGGGQAPPAIRARFPDLVPEVPRSFARTIQGNVPLTRVGWAVIRPTAAP